MSEPRSRAVKDSTKKSYMLEQVDRKLLEDATAKAKTLIPSETLKTRILRLLAEWTYGQPTP